MNKRLLILLCILSCTSYISCNDVLGCGGFIKSHVVIDFSKIVVKLVTKQGILKDKTNCAPNGYYFIPLYDKGDYILQLEPPPGWSFTPTKVNINVDGQTDICSQGKDTNFVFKGFGITGKVESLGSVDGPAGITVALKSSSEVRKTTTNQKGIFFFTPVYPGNYEVIISHPKWRLLKSKLSVTVVEGNTELPPNSLMIAGFDVKGSVKSDGQPIKDIKILLYPNENKNAQVENCDKTRVKDFNGSNTYICHVISDETGNFIFPSLSNGNYYLVPYFKSTSVYFEPQIIYFSVNHDSVVLDKVFEIVGFSISGKVFTAPNGEPLQSAIITIDNEEIAQTGADGSYTLDKIVSNTYTISVKADDFKFEPKTVKLHPSLDQVPTIYAVAFKVCGSVISDKMESVDISITKLGSVQHFMVKSDPTTGDFCEYLAPGKYSMEVYVKGTDKGLQFFPFKHTVEVTTKVLSNIIFSQLKSTVTGKVLCLESEACKKMKIHFIPSHSESGKLTADIVDQTYTFTDVRPGMYKVQLPVNNLCWKENEHSITITNSTFEVPPFVHTGYSVVFTSSHDTKVNYKLPGDDTKLYSLIIPKGTSKHCVQKAGSYEFILDSCHIYASNVISFNTAEQTNELFLTSDKHKMSFSISAARDLGDIIVSVNIGGVKTKEGPIKYKNNKYNLELSLSAGEDAILVPQSDILYFNPPILSVTGIDDCTDFGVKFQALKGKVFKGKIDPPLQDVQITIASDGIDPLMDETDSDGNYRFPPLDDSKTYKITATKESYTLIGPDENGNFLAHKLAEVIVEVVDEADNTPLFGALISLSGSESYRRNLQTNDDGKIVFPGLNPSEYFLKPMMKEYNFEPSSKIINVKVGASVKVLLKGRRIAYSAFGQITSLNNQPEEQLTIVALGQSNCSQYSEETNSESNGMFRIRGLVPYCSYDIKLKKNADERDFIDRSLPAVIHANSVKKDITDLKMIVFRPASNTDILIKIYTQNPDYYKNLRIKVSRDSVPANLIHTIKVDNFKIPQEYNAGVLIQIPSIPLDGKMYSVQLESSVPALNKGKPQIKTFISDSSFKYFQFDFVVKTSISDQNIKQTSVWTLIFIFVVMVAAYNIDKIVNLLKMNVPSNLLESLMKSKSSSSTEYVMDNNDIDQIVESINAPKKKVKSKRI